MNSSRHSPPESGGKIAQSRLPLSLRLFFFLSLFFILFSLPLWIYSSNTFKEILYESEFEKTWSNLLNLKTIAIESFLDDDHIKMRSIGSHIKDDELVRSLVFSDRNGKILSSSNKELVGKKYIDQERLIFREYENFKVYKNEENNIYKLRSKLNYKDIEIGNLSIHLLKKNLELSIEDKLSNYSKGYFLSNSILFILILATSTLVSRLIKQRLKKLTTSTGATQHETAGLYRNDEFGDRAEEVQKLLHSHSAKQQLPNNVVENLNYNILDKILQAPPQNTSNSSYASRRQVTVLYAGIAGFSQYASHTKAEEVIEALNEYIGLATNTIKAHGGYVDKFLGDAVVGIFGVSMYRENHTLRAVRAAWEIQNQPVAEHEKRKTIRDRVRIGMSSGVVISGNIGSESRIEYSSIGESVKEAFWLNDLAEAKEIVISKNIYEIIKEIATVEDMPSLSIAGREAEIESFRLKNITENHSNTDGRK